MGMKEEALSELTQALALTPQLVDWSKQDPDLNSLHDEPAFNALYE